MESGKIITWLFALLLIAVSLPMASAALDDSIVSYWKLDDASGAIVDQLGTNDGTNSGASYGATGIINDALDFESTESDFVNITDDPSLDFTTEVTANLWIKKESAGGDYVGIFSNDYSQDRSAFIIGSMTNTSLRVWSYQSGDKFAMFTPAVSVGDWHMITLVYNGTAYGGARVYIDGVVTNLATPLVSSLPQNTYGFKMGSYNGAYFDGLIDEIGLWDRALTYTEVQSLYAGGVGNTYPFSTDTFPEISLGTPANAAQTTNGTITFNVNVTDNSLVQNVTLYIDGVLNQTNSSNFNGTYIFNAGVDIGTHNWSILAFDNASQSTQSATRTFEYQRVLENSVTFTTPITEGTSNVYTINLSTDGSTISTAYFNYSGTDYLLTPYTYTDYIILNKTLTTPLVTGSVNKTFNWRITFDDTYQFNTTQYNQLVSDVLVDNCSLYNFTFYNFTIVNEETQVALVGSTDNTYAEIDLDLSLADGTALQGYSTTFNQTNPFALCISDNLTGSSGVFVDAQIQYKADGYVAEFYNIQSENFTSSDLNTNITLYDLNSSDAQEFLLTYTDTNFNPVEGAIILIKRKYISEGVFKTVEIPITDANGQSLANLVLSNVIYSFTVMKDGLLLATFDNQVAYCDNIATGDCQIDLSTYSTTSLPDTFSTVGNYVFSIDYNKTSRLITADFTVSSGATATNFLNVTLYGYGGATSICTDTLVTASGTRTCTIPSQYENSTVIIQLSRDGELVGEAIFTLNQDPHEIYGDSRVFIAIIAFLLIIGIGIVDSPQIQIVLMIVGAVMLVATGLINSGPASSFVGAGATILFFIIALILILVKGGRR